MDWVGKYFLGALGLYAVTAPSRARARAEKAETELRFQQAFKDFARQDACEFLTSEVWKVSNIPCFFEHADGQITEFVYEPAAPEKLTQWQLDMLTKFIDFYGMKVLQPGIMLSRDGLRDEAICFLWFEKSNNTHIDRVSRAVRLLKS